MSPARAAVRKPDVHLPPPVFYLLGLVAGSVLSQFYPTRWMPPTLAFVVGAALIFVSLVIAVSALQLFVRARTSPFPWRPATQLIVDGVYRITRNPMYVALALLYLGVSALVQSLWSVLLLPLVVIAVDRYVIRREEAHLHERFGHDYHRYTQMVRRWL